jgi:tetratricopeptide (TPR) repeat protein
MVGDHLLQQGISAFQAGRRPQARARFTRLIEGDPDNELAWLWLSGAVETDGARRDCLEKVLEINPHNGIAHRALQSLRKRSLYLLAVRGTGFSPPGNGSPPTGEVTTGVDGVNGLLQEAVTAIESGDKERGKQLLVQLLKRDEDHQSAWLWMTHCVAERDVKRECFERVLEINPDNEYAIRGIKRLDALARAEASNSRNGKPHATPSSRGESSDGQRPPSEKRNRITSMLRLALAKRWHAAFPIRHLKKSPRRRS